VLIIDSCQAAAVAGKDFKAGPVGDRSFGQLVYDKKMRMLVGSQADSVALEDGRVQHGLLAYALLHDGISGLEADFRPIDHSIATSEWLQYGVEDVAQLQGRIATWNDQDLDSKGFKVAARAANGGFIAQRPQLFDFGGPNDSVISGVPFYDPRNASSDSTPEEAEVKAAIGISDPVASAAALRRFISHTEPGAPSAVAWTLLTRELLAGHAKSADLISAARMSLSHLAIVGDRETAKITLTIVAEELEHRGDYPEIVTEFRKVVQQIAAANGE
jgi:hypothetical protein